MTANFFAALRTVKPALSLLGLDSALRKASVKVSATESREAGASAGLTQNQIDRSNFDCPDPSYLIGSSLYCHVVANRLVAAPVRHRCAQRRDPLKSNYLNASQAL